MRAIVLCSGGLDSTTLAYELRANNTITLVGFDYGQRHRKELDAMLAIGHALDVPRLVVALPDFAGHLQGSALTLNGPDVPDGHYTEESMRATIVPNRNMIMLAIAAGIAVANGANAVACAVHAGDHAIYPDCRPAFVHAMRVAIRLGAARPDGDPIDLWTPYVHRTKADIVKLGSGLGVPFAATWSCYKGGDIHCGRCGTCVERIEAFLRAHVVDPTEYADSNYAIDLLADRASNWEGVS